MIAEEREGSQISTLFKSHWDWMLSPAVTQFRERLIECLRMRKTDIWQSWVKVTANSYQANDSSSQKKEKACFVAPRIKVSLTPFVCLDRRRLTCLCSQTYGLSMQHANFDCIWPKGWNMKFSDHYELLPLPGIRYLTKQQWIHLYERKYWIWNKLAMQSKNLDISFTLALHEKFIKLHS